MTATEPGRLSLLMTEGPSPGLRILLPIKESAYIGRHPKCQVVIDHPLVSRRHCTVTTASDGSGVEIMDLDSNNGVRVNGQRIAAGVTVGIGKRFTVGPSVFEVQRWISEESEDGSDLNRDDVLDILGLSADDPALQAMPTDDWDETASGPGGGAGVSKVFELDDESKPVQIAKAVRDFAAEQGVGTDDLQDLAIDTAALCESVVRLQGNGELVARVADGELKIEVKADWSRTYRAK